MRLLRLSLKLLLVLLLGLGFVMSAALAWLQWGGGAAALAGLAGRLVPGLVIEGLTIALPGEIGAARITLADEAGPWLEVTAPRIVFDPMALPRHEAHLLSLTAGRVALTRLPTSDSAPQEGPLLPSLPRLPIRLRLDRLVIAEIDLAEAVFGQAFRASAEGKAVLRAAQLVGDLALTRLDAPGSARLAVDLAPGVDRLLARLDVTEPAGGVMASALGAPAEAAQVMLSLQGPASGAALLAEARLGSLAAATFSGTISADAAGAGFARLSGHVTAAPLWPEALAEALRRIDLSLDAARDRAGQISLSNFTLRAPLGEAMLSGRLDPKREEAALQGRFVLGASAMVRAYLPDELAWQGLSAAFRLDGALAAPKLALDAALVGFSSTIPALETAMGPSPSLRLEASAPTRIESLTLMGAGVQLTASGDIGEALDISFGLELADLAPLVPEFAGALTAQGHLHGAWDNPSVTLQARGGRITRGTEALTAPSLDIRLETPLTRPYVEARLRASYRGLPVMLDVFGVPEAAALRLRQFDATFGPARLSGSGLLDIAKPHFTGALALSIPDLAPFSDLLGHAMTGALTLEAEGRVVGSAQQATAKLTAPDISLDGRALALHFDATGGLDDGRLGFSARHGETRLAGAAAFTASGAARLLTLSEFVLAHGPEQLSLTVPARVEISPDGRITLAEATLTSNRGGRLRLDGFWAEPEIALNAALTALPIAPFAGLALPEAQLVGTVSGQATIRGSAAEPRFDINLESPSLISAAPAARGVPPLRLVAAAKGSAAGAEASLSLNGGSVVRLAASARLAGLSPEAALSGSITGRLELGGLAQPLLAAGAQRVTGIANLNLRLAGSLAAPRLGGQASIANGSFRDLQHGVALQDMTATISAEDRRFVLQGFTARTAGGGRLAGSGTLDINERRLPFDLRLTADAARPVNSDLGSATLDGEARLSGALLGESRLSGRLLVRRAELRIPDKLPPSIQSLPGVRERGQRPPGVPALAPPRPGDASEAALPPMALDLTIEAPRAIFLRGRGLDAELGGGVRLAGMLNAPALEGGFMLRRGTLRVLDRRLELNRANIGFGTGGIMPHLDVAARTRAEEVEITVALEGPARDPKISFTSNPELPADEVLARLLFGRRGGDLSPFQMLQLAEALSGATGRPLPGPGGLTERIRRVLALDRLSIGQEKEGEQRAGEEPGATLETGRYVADGVFLGLRQSADGGPPRVGVQIDLMPRLRLEAESGGNSLAGDRVGIGFEYEY